MMDKITRRFRNKYKLYKYNRKKRMSKIARRIQNIGPGAMVSAAFIGPGTITTCIKAGVEGGYSLLWAVLFSTIATIFLQEMASRIGVVTQMGLGENIRFRAKNAFLRWLSVASVVVAIFVGNSAFETGNITGSVMGLNIILPSLNVELSIIIIGVVALVLLLTGTHKNIEKILTVIVGIMVALFLVTALISKPDWSKVFKGMFTPSLGQNGLMTVVGLIGTTIGPYSMFLHATAATKKWDSDEDVVNSRIDTVISIGIGGLITMCIIIVVASFANDNNISINNTADLANAIAPIWGSWSRWLFGVGLFAAGISSVITAPLGSAYAVTGVLGKKADLSSMFVKAICSVVVITGIVLSLLFGKSPTQLILVAQVANAIILPFIALFLIICANSKQLGKYKNGILTNIVSVIIVITCILISYRNLTGFVETLKSLLS